MEPDLSLEKAVSYARQREAVKKQQSVVHGETQPNVDAVKAHHHHKAHPQAKKGQAKSFAPQSSDRQGPKRKCTQCGQTPSHNRESCPARDAICHRCKNRGHFKSQCRTNNIYTIVAEVTLMTTFLLLLSMIMNRETRGLPTYR